MGTHSHDWQAGNLLCADEAGKLATGRLGGLSGDLPTELPLKIRGKLSVEVQPKVAGGKHW